MHQKKPHKIQFSENSVISPQHIRLIGSEVTEIQATQCTIKVEALELIARRSSVPENTNHRNKIKQKHYEHDTTIYSQEQPLKIKHLSLVYIKYHLNVNTIKTIGLRCIGQMRYLVTLNLSSNDIGDEGLQHFRNLLQLKELCLSQNRIRNEGVFQLTKIPKLTKLELGRVRLGIEGALLLTKFVGLRNLEVSDDCTFFWNMLHLNRVLYRCELQCQFDFTEKRKGRRS